MVVRYGSYATVIGATWFVGSSEAYLSPLALVVESVLIVEYNLAFIAVFRKTSSIAGSS